MAAAPHQRANVPPNVAARVPAVPAPALPSDPNATPKEIPLAAAGGWRFLGMGGVPLITRTEGGVADRRRIDFLRFFISRLNVAVPLGIYAFAMGNQWGRNLKGYPQTFLQPSLRNLPTEGLPDLVVAVAVLMRMGLLVVEGFGADAVTRTDGHVSFQGGAFIRGEEGSRPGLYWPGNDKSGVTVDPGYDMGGRSSQDVTSDLAAVGVPQDAATTAALGAHMRGADAGAFATQNRNAVLVTHPQAAQLFDRVVPTYESLVRDTLPRSLPLRLFQHEFDALTSLAWNTSRFGHYTCNDDLRRLDLVRAIPDWMTLTGGGPGIVRRRTRETTLFRDAIYMTQSLPPGPLVPSGLPATGGDVG